MDDAGTQVLDLIFWKEFENEIVGLVSAFCQTHRAPPNDTRHSIFDSEHQNLWSLPPFSGIYQTVIVMRHQLFGFCSVSVAYVKRENAPCLCSFLLHSIGMPLN